MTNNDLLRILERTSYAAHRDEDDNKSPSVPSARRAALKCLAITEHKEKLVAVATNGRRLAAVDIADLDMGLMEQVEWAPTSSPLWVYPQQGLYPAAVVEALVAIFQSDRQGQIGFAEAGVQIRDSITILFEKPALTFPDWRAVTKIPHLSDVSVNRHELMSHFFSTGKAPRHAMKDFSQKEEELLRRMGGFKAGPAINTLRLTIERGSEAGVWWLVLTGREKPMRVPCLPLLSEPHLGIFKESNPEFYRGSGSLLTASIQLNDDYLVEAVSKTLCAENIRIQFTSQFEPVEITDIDGPAPKGYAMIMPVRDPQ